MPRKRHNPQPLEAAALEDLALAYAARYASTRAKLAAYLARKLRERGWAGEGAPPVEAMVERFAAMGYVDDAAYARAKAGSLLRRGYGARRVNQALGAAGVDPQVRNAVEIGESERRHAALTLARKRRFGPFGQDAGDRSLREKQIAAMMRAGHALDHVMPLLCADSVEAAQDWAMGGEGED